MSIQYILLTFPMNVNKLLDADSFSREDLISLEKTIEYITSKITDESSDSPLPTPKECKLAIDGMRLLADKRGISVDVTSLREARENVGEALEKLWSDSDITGYPHGVSNKERNDILTILTKVIGQLAAGSEKDIWIRTQVAHLVRSNNSTSLTSLLSSSVSANAKNKFLLEVLCICF